MNSKNISRHMEAVPEESHLVHRARSGDPDAFVLLYDAYGDDVYRYVYFRVMNDVAAEDITSQVFRHAWEHLESCKKDGSSFVTWIYKIARNKVLDYYKIRLKTYAFNIGFLSAATAYGLNKEDQDLSNLEGLRNHLQFLTADKQKNPVSTFFNRGAIDKNIAHSMSRFEGYVLPLQMRTLQTVAGYLEGTDPGRELKPSPTFNAYTRSWLTQYMRSHARRPQSISMSWRTSLIIAGLIAALLVTGTAHAQSALPGEPFYGWKRTSEQAWRTLSSDPVGTDIILANRRLNEWIAVENDPARSATAKNDYFEELTRLKSTGDAETRARITPMLKAHKQVLNNAGLSTTQLDNYLAVAADPILIVTPTEVSPAGIVNAATDIPVKGGSTEVPTEVAPTGASTEVAPTEVPTQVAPTDIPTEVEPTDVPTEVAPTDIPTEVASPPTDVPTEVAPPATNVPPAATDSPETTPTDANP